MSVDAAPPFPSPSTWVCDRCHRDITDPWDAFVFYRTGDDLRDRDFILAHRGRCDPGSNGPTGYPMSVEIGRLIGADGQAYLLSLLSPGLFHLTQRDFKPALGPANMDEFIDLFRRLQTPFYEQARRHFGCPAVREDYMDAGTEPMYTPGVLADVAAHDGECLLV